MPRKSFFQLNINKRNRIINAGLSEFSQYSYNEASTNSIVKKAYISKGSLFKYFINKEDLYFYILDYVIADLSRSLKDELPKLKGDLFQIVLIYAEAEFNWYIENTNKYRLLKRAFSDDNSSIYIKTMERYKLIGDSFYYKILENIETQILNWEKEKVLNILKWILEGLNEKFMKEADQYSNINDIKDCYFNELNQYIEMLKKGLYK
ncbi:TetR/AcrR family transcriptional regulator [Schnuerera sp. xch1]|uniref:TetR/AcrR family transcriptional regulator n=1 Tax=Schnuerera sp. xch1 TaxID=2874283 RepID=UPI001CBB967E|nr:TetR/AcrR family transcriptional regulator [Schnuerera sp. xch1]MBZ2174338.1 TetR/AcrR family transcriptional regulator [Schnuerera sp. xch1]